MSLILNTRLFIEWRRLRKLGDHSRNSLYEKFFWINDVMVCVPPFCLLMLSADLRNAVVKFLRCRRHRRGSTAPASIGNR
ncbi:hypothetical protein GCK32_010808 [Trichostrongylus colubriformis]|uniref:Uncharacterized protein n=1 Tax=Trichostrongylus colubriformis TaxID=6319 RepID=A0AAN8J2Q2_TRICO